MTEVENSLLKENGKDLFGQPRGLAYIVFTEAWERFSFYGMQSLLILYMATYLLLPENAQNVIGLGWVTSLVQSVFGSLSPNGLATQLFGLYIGFVYFMPVLGGWLGDRFLGRTKSVLMGAVMMGIGHFMMAFEPLFLFALLFLILGSGLLKGNLAAQVGNLYAKADQRRDTAFTVYSVAINVGGFVAPLVCGTLGEIYGWHYGFTSAGIGMFIGTAIYLSGLSYMPREAKVLRKRHDTTSKLSLGDFKVIFCLVIILCITSLYWTAQSQVWTAYPLWINDRVDRDILGLVFPVTWFQSIDMFAVLVFAPLVVAFWKRQSARDREPGMLRKIATGCTVFAMAYAWLGVSEVFSEEIVNPTWPFLFHFICAIGFLYIGPVTLSLISRTAPAPVNAMMMGSYYLAIFLGGIFSGYLGKYYEILDATIFWFLHAFIVFMGAVLLTALSGPLKRNLRLEK